MTGTDHSDVISSHVDNVPIITSIDMNIYKHCRQTLFAAKKIFVRRVSPRIASRLLFLLMCNLRVVHYRVVQVQCELFCGESPLNFTPPLHP